MEYITRIVDKEIKKKLSTMGAIEIKGPKWCGKTTSAMQVAKSKVEMQNPEKGKEYKELALTKPSLLLEGEKPRLIDEWQIVPSLWNAVRYDVDKTSNRGQYILTGSATPNDTDEEYLHSGVGRFAIINMKPFTLYESKDSNGKISLKDVFDKKVHIDGIKSNITYERLAYLICRGGWPTSIDLPEDNALEIAKNYIDVLCESDISKVDNKARNPRLTRNILRSYARQVSTINSDKSLYQDVIANYNEVTDRTIIDYIHVLERLHIIEEIEAWNPNIRSKTAIRTAKKKSMVDPSLAVASLGASPKDIMLDVNTFGLLFENLVDRDLSVYVNSIGGYAQHYRDRYGLECDCVLHLNDGRYGLIEAKLGGVEHIKEGEKHLLELKKLINANKRMKEPEFLMVITGFTDIAYTTNNGVMVVPLGCLKD